MNVPGVREETVLRYKVNGSAEDDRHVIGASPRRHQRRGVSPLLSMVRDSSATLVSTAMCIPFMRSSRNSTTPMALPFVDYLGADDGDAQAR